MSLSILWTEVPEPDASLIRQVAEAEDAQVEQIAHELLTTAIVAAIASGGVVYVAASSRDASLALGSGADEVVRVGHVTRRNVLRALRRATLRAKARAARCELAGRAPEDVGRVLSLLTAAVGHEMNTPLSVALLTCDALTEGLPQVLDVHERLVGWAALAAPQAEVRSLVETLAQQPSASELRAMLLDLRDGIGRAVHIARLLRRLGADHLAATTSAAETIADVHELLRGPLMGTEVLIDVRGRCEVRVGQPALVMLLAGLLAHVIEALRAVPTEKPRLELTACEQDDAVLVEIAHNGAAVPADLRPGILEPYFALATRGASDLTLEGLQKRARTLGGDLLVLIEQGTTLRLVLPGLAADIDSPALVPEQTPVASRRRDE